MLKIKRRNFIKLTGYGGVGLAGALQSDRTFATVFTQELSNLPTFDFSTIKVDRTGKETQHTYHQAHLYTENLSNYQNLAMVSIPAGKFIMGAPTKEKYSSDRERPLIKLK